MTCSDVMMALDCDEALLECFSLSVLVGAARIHDCSSIRGRDRGIASGLHAQDVTTRVHGGPVPAPAPLER